MNWHHDQQMKHGDNDPSQFESLSHQKETGVNLHSMHNWQITSSQQLETQQKWGKCIWDHQRQNECDIGPSYLKTNVSLFCMKRMLKKSEYKYFIFIIMNFVAKCWNNCFKYLWPFVISTSFLYLCNKKIKGNRETTLLKEFQKICVKMNKEKSNACIKIHRHLIFLFEVKKNFKASHTINI